VRQFSGFCAEHGIEDLAQVEPVHVATFVEAQLKQNSKPTVENGGKEHEMPTHHNLDRYLEEYIRAAGIAEDRKGPLFRTARGRSRELTGNALLQSDVWRMIRRRALAAGIKTEIGCHTFRATGITAYLKNGGRLEVAQQMAAHESARTTGLYDRRSDEVSLDEVERIGFDYVFRSVRINPGRHSSLCLLATNDRNSGSAWSCSGCSSPGIDLASDPQARVVGAAQHHSRAERGTRQTSCRAVAWRREHARWILRVAAGYGREVAGCIVASRKHHRAYTV
jgi:Phage integrase family